MHTPDPILALMDRFTAAINAHDLDAVLALVTEDIVFESTSPPPDGARYEGRAAVAQVWGTCWHRRLPIFTQRIAPQSEATTCW
jgi:ketosteroid isomerase-like protein